MTVRGPLPPNFPFLCIVLVKKKRVGAIFLYCNCLYSNRLLDGRRNVKRTVKRPWQLRHVTRERRVPSVGGSGGQGRRSTVYPSPVELVIQKFDAHR